MVAKLSLSPPTTINFNNNNKQHIFLIVPNSSSSSKRIYKIPVQIHLFAIPQAFTAVISAVTESRLSLVRENSPCYTLSDAEIVKERRNCKGLKSIDDIFDNVAGMGVKVGPANKVVPPKEVVLSELFEHQKEGLGWLLERENSQELPPFWEERKEDGVFVNVLTNFQMRDRPEPIRGGIKLIEWFSS